MEQYRCHTVWTPSTNATRIVETVKWLPHAFKMSTASREALILAAADDLQRALRAITSSPDLEPLQPSTIDTLTQLTSLFSGARFNKASRTKRTPLFLLPPLQPRVPTLAPQRSPLYLPPIQPRVPLYLGPTTLKLATPTAPIIPHLPTTTHTLQDNVPQKVGLP